MCNYIFYPFRKSYPCGMSSEKRHSSSDAEICGENSTTWAEWFWWDLGRTWEHRHSGEDLSSWCFHSTWKCGVHESCVVSSEKTSLFFWPENSRIEFDYLGRLILSKSQNSRVSTFGGGFKQLVLSLHLKVRSPWILCRYKRENITLLPTRNYPKETRVPSASSGFTYYHDRHQATHGREWRTHHETQMYSKGQGGNHFGGQPNWGGRNYDPAREPRPDHRGHGAPNQQTQTPGQEYRCHHRSQRTRKKGQSP